MARKGESTLQGASGPSVTIDPTQLPLPVTGTVAATQSGPWNVGVTGTPNVNVANAITAPVPVLDISHSASHHVSLDCFVSASASVGAICSDQSTGAVTPYVVPAGQNLVVTSVDITNAGLPNRVVLVLPGSSSSLLAGSWSVPDNLTHSFQYPSGIVFPAGYSFSIQSFNLDILNSLAILHGFLTSN